MTSPTALLSKWPLIRQIRRRADGTGLELAHTPPELVMAHLHIDRATYDVIPRNGVSVTPLS